MAAKINYSTPTTSTPSPYAESQNFDFTATPSPLPGQRENYKKFNADYTNFINAQETPTQIADRYANKYNVPYLQEQQQKNNLMLGALSNQITALPTSINSASGNSMLTQGQKDRLVANQSAPLTQNYNALAQNANNVNQASQQATENVDRAIGFEQADQMKKLAPWLQQYDFDTIANAAENTQWTQTNQWEFNRLIANQQAGVTLSEGEQGRLFELASQEAAFQAALDQIHAQGEEARATKKAPTDLASLWSSMGG
jgi:hypothetical protein